MSEPMSTRVPVGTRIMLTSMPDDPDPIPVGSVGIVIRASDEQLIVNWENGRSLNIVIGVDEFTVVTSPADYSHKPAAH